MNKIIAYKILWEEALCDLQTEVEENMEKGWHPWGALATDRDGYYLQTVVKYKE